LTANEQTQWMFIADVNQTINSITEISEKIKTDTNIAVSIQEDIDRGTSNLLELAGAEEVFLMIIIRLKNGISAPIWHKQILLFFKMFKSN